MWRSATDNRELGNRIPGITRDASILAARYDNTGRGVVKHPKTREPIYWENKTGRVIRNFL
jgi:hypothetical protein